jgi:hypothetical protein
VAGLRPLRPRPQQLVLHRQLAELGAEPSDSLIARIRPATADRRLSSGEKLLTPLRQGRRSHT